MSQNDPLVEYNRKRNFRRTPEPPGERDIIDDLPASALSGRTIDEIARAEQ